MNSRSLSVPHCWQRYVALYKLVFWTGTNVRRLMSTLHPRHRTRGALSIRYKVLFHPPCNRVARRTDGEKALRGEYSSELFRLHVVGDARDSICAALSCWSHPASASSVMPWQPNFGQSGVSRIDDRHAPEHG